MMLKKVYFDKEFSLQYQPQVSSIDGKIIGVEAYYDGIPQVESTFRPIFLYP